MYNERDHDVRNKINEKSIFLLYSIIKIDNSQGNTKGSVCIYMTIQSYRFSRIALWLQSVNAFMTKVTTAEICFLQGLVQCSREQ